MKGIIRMGQCYWIRKVFNADLYPVPDPIQIQGLITKNVICLRPHAIAVL
jgi:hypothetical protein